MRTHYYFDEMIKLARNILSDSWYVHYVNVETRALELRAYNGLSMCVIVVEDEDFDDPLISYYNYKEEE